MALSECSNGDCLSTSLLLPLTMQPTDVLSCLNMHVCLFPSFEGLKHMSVSELSELLDRVEVAIRDYSEELVQQLARRDELEFEKEVKNSFITVLMEVQNKQKEHREVMKRRRKEKGLSLQSSRIERAAQMPLKVSKELKTMI